MKRKPNKEESEPNTHKKQVQKISKSLQKGEFYECGGHQCGRNYHSYSAFSNHCNKNHDGEFPKASKIDGLPFGGPQKNRGRPKRKKESLKNEQEIESIKAYNELINFIGTFQRQERKSSYMDAVDDPVEHLEQTAKLIQSRDQAQECKMYCQELLQFNQIISENDLPEFYDPKEMQGLEECLDSYDFTSIYEFVSRKEIRKKYHIRDSEYSLLRKVLIVHLARIVKVELLVQIILLIIRKDFKVVVVNQLLDQEEVQEFLSLVDGFFEGFLKKNQGKVISH